VRSDLSAAPARVALVLALVVVGCLVCLVQAVVLRPWLRSAGPGAVARIFGALAYAPVRYLVLGREGDAATESLVWNAARAGGLAGLVFGAQTAIALVLEPRPARDA
jgi:hypothetical protein